MLPRKSNLTTNADLAGVVTCKRGIEHFLIKPNKNQSYLDKLAPVGDDLLAGGGLELLVAGGDLLALHPDPRDDVALEHLDQLLLVGHQLVQGVDRDLIMTGYN